MININAFKIASARAWYQNIFLTYPHSGDAFKQRETLSFWIYNLWESLLETIFVLLAAVKSPPERAFMVRQNQRPATVRWFSA